MWFWKVVIVFFILLRVLDWVVNVLNFKIFCKFEVDLMGSLVVIICNSKLGM